MQNLTCFIAGFLILGALGASCDGPTARPTFSNAGSKNSDSADVKQDSSKVPNPYSSTTKKPAADSGDDTDSMPTPDTKQPVDNSDDVVVTPEKPVVTPEQPTDACKGFSWESVKTPEDALCFKSIDEVLASIPERVRSNFVLIRETRSAQSASLTKPRIVIMSPDGSFIVTAATDQTSSKDLEIAVYDYKKNVWDFAGIDYTQTPAKVEKNLCKTCHGEEPHPIWTEYPNWPSAFAGNTQTLTNEEAVIMNEIASKKSALPFVKYLVTRSSYKAGNILYPASKYSGSENNQTLNIVIAIRAARSLVSKLYDKGVDEAKLLQIAGETMCSGRGDTIADLGFKLNKELNHGLVGQDKERVIWSGNALGSYFVGIEILNQVFKRNPGIKTQLPSVASLVERKEFQLYRSESLKEFFAAEDALKGSWQAVDNGFFRGTFKSAFKSGSQHCKELDQ